MPSQEGLGDLIHLDSLVQNILLRLHNASHVKSRIKKGMKFTAVVAREAQVQRERPPRVQRPAMNWRTWCTYVCEPSGACRTTSLDNDGCTTSYLPRDVVYVRPMETLDIVRAG